MIEAMYIVHNLNRYEITSYSRDANIFNITLVGSTYAETEFTIYYGDGDSKAELPVTIPPFEDSLNMKIAVRRKQTGYFAEVYPVVGQ